MVTFSQAFYTIKNNLAPIYGEREAAAIAHEVTLHITGKDKMERLMLKDQQLTDLQQRVYDASLQRLIAGEPMQYVIGSAWFMGKEYFVNKEVLIPRPETEELVDWIVTDHARSAAGLTILDIGTGSGCIPISLKSLIPEATVTSCDISTGAIETARLNAERLKTEIELIQLDFLNEELRNKLGIFNVIVSNPPYIPITDRDSLQPHVRDHEPGLALFVPGSDPLLFYKAIAIFGKEHLSPDGSIYCEMESTYAQECETLFKIEGFGTVTVKMDMHGNWRMLKATLA